MDSTMMDRPLLISDIFRFGARVYADSEVITFEGDRSRRATYAEVADNVGRLANALAGLGVAVGDRVGTFMWNDQEHLEAYFAVPCMGAVLHTVNIRLFPEQMVYVVKHADDRVLIVSGSLAGLMAPLAPAFTSVDTFIVTGGVDLAPLVDALAAAGSTARVLRYEELIADQPTTYDWPEVDERSAAAMCYTSGTTGNPKGVVYSHRSQYIHALAGTSSGTIGVSERDRILAVVPMFHANAWGLPYIGWLVGADFLMPERFLQAAPLATFIQQERPTFAGAVPTIWNDLLLYAEANAVDLSSFTRVVCGGSAVPRFLMESYEAQFGVKIFQAWGMTETSPIGAVALPPAHNMTEDEWYYRCKTGRAVPGVDVRITDDDGNELPWDNAAVGEIEVRGPWITGSYYLDDAPEKFHDGWLRTGDVGTIDAKGYVQITDRAKDVIKSGGEWISSVELENALMAHPDVAEAAVVAVPDAKWQERPLACVVRKDGRTVDPEALRAHLADHVAKWWLPERWSFVDAIPKTSVGKFDKKVIRQQFGDGQLVVESVGGD